MLTIPRSLFKSSTKDLSSPIFELVIRRRLSVSVLWTLRVSLPCYDLDSSRSEERGSPSLMHGEHWGGYISPLNQHGFGLRGVQP
jgi:hypothetical protein